MNNVNEKQIIEKLLTLQINSVDNLIVKVKSGFEKITEEIKKNKIMMECSDNMLFFHFIHSIIMNLLEKNHKYSDMLFLNNEKDKNKYFKIVLDDINNIFNKQSEEGA